MKACLNPLMLCMLALVLLQPVSHAAAADEEILWTQVPTRIDRSKQRFERLPAVKTAIDRRNWIVIPARIVVLDSARFSVDGKIYHIGDIHPVRSKRLCKAVEGGLWGCGRMGAVLLGNLVRDKRLLCDIVPGEKETVLTNCLSGKADVAREILSRGFGRVNENSPLISFQRDGQTKKAGMWRNPDCLVDFDHC